MKNTVCGISFIIVAFIILFTACDRNAMEIMAVTGATPVALQEKVPSDTALRIEGMVKKTYELSGSALRALAPVRLRVHERKTDGTYMGSYAYTGIPVLHILEGVAPQKPKDAAFDRPLDMIVTVKSRRGDTVLFSYGEIIFSDDRNPVMLAYDRKELKSSKDPEKYDKNIYKDNVKGLRLVCPDDRDDSRFLDDVVSISLSVMDTPDSVLPALRKGAKCESKGVRCVDGKKMKPLKTAGCKEKSVSDWVRFGHGRGYKRISSATGYDLRALLRKNFSSTGRDDFFLFTACDGYRVLFSAREIFESGDGESYMLLKTEDGKSPHGGPMLAPVADFYVDRDVWGLTHIVRLPKP